MISELLRPAAFISFVTFAEKSIASCVGNKSVLDFARSETTLAISEYDVRASFAASKMLCCTSFASSRLLMEFLIPVFTASNSSISSFIADRLNPIPIVPSSFVAVLFMSDIVPLTFLTSLSFTLNPTLLTNSAIVTSNLTFFHLCVFSIDSRIKFC